MIELAPERLAAESELEVLREGPGGRAVRASVDSRTVGPGELFFGLPGERSDGGEFAAQALGAGAWGVVVDRERAAGLLDAGPDLPGEGYLFASDDPLRSLGLAARAWRRALGARVVGITGSTGKTSVKDIVRALIPARVHASRQNFNTEIGLPLSILEAPPETEVLVLEMAMRGRGQIAALCAIAEPDVAAITNIGPVHLELLGTIEAIAAAKAEILAGLGAEGTAVVPAEAEALEPHLDRSLKTITFGAGGDVFARSHERRGETTVAEIASPGGEKTFELPFAERHNLENALCAVAVGVALGHAPQEMARRAPDISFSRLRGERIALPGGGVLVNDCYNANPISMRAALEHLVSLDVPGRRIAVLGGMAELGSAGPGYHHEIAAFARGVGVAEIVGVGELARDYAPERWAADPAGAAAAVAATYEPGDAILVKGSRSVGLERFTEELVATLADGRG